MKSRDEIVREVVPLYYPWCMKDGRLEVNADASEIRRAVDLVEKALNLAVPPGHVVVKVEDLRSIEAYYDEHDEECYCPECKYMEDLGHYPDCWLAAALKEGDSHD